MFSGCVSEAVVELSVDVPLDGGDLFLLGGLEAKGCSKWFELEGGRQVVGRVQLPFHRHLFRPQTRGPHCQAQTFRGFPEMRHCFH